MRDVIRRNWRFWVTLAEVLVLTAFLAHYIGRRQTIANERNERQRSAICAILTNIPGRIPPEIARARIVFARPGHPGDCQPVSHPKLVPKPTPKPTGTANPTPTATVVITRSLAQPTATATATPRPTPTRSPRPTPSPAPKPSPSSTCLPMTRICT